MGFVRIFWKNNIQGGLLAKNEHFSEIVAHAVIIRKLHTNPSNFFWVDPQQNFYAVFSSLSPPPPPLFDSPHFFLSFGVSTWHFREQIKFPWSKKMPAMQARTNQSLKVWSVQYFFSNGEKKNLQKMGRIGKLFRDDGGHDLPYLSVRKDLGRETKQA